MKSVKTEIVYDHIRGGILNGDFGLRDALMMAALANEIDSSRAPGRDALRKLEGDGLVMIQPRLGARVKQFDHNEFREICELRLALEAPTAGPAAKHRTAEDLREIEAPLVAMRALSAGLRTSRLRAPKLQKLAAEDGRFHIAIMVAVKNELMQKEVLRLHLIHRIAQTPIGQKISAADPREAQVANSDRVLAEHEEIFVAIATGKVRASKLAMETHLENLIEISLRKLEQEERERGAQTTVADQLVYLA